MITITEQAGTSALTRLRAKLGQKAKLEPEFRFYTLYHHISRQDTLLEAWKCVKRNGGSPGIDGVSIEDIEKSTGGVEQFLQEIRDNLKSKSYHPKPVKRVYIPKSDGKLRSLGIPTIQDRVVQAAVVLILEPIFEEDFLNSSYGFRPGKSAHQAIAAIKQAIRKGQLEVYDADLKSYFDTIPHDKLMKALERRIADRQLLKLIRKWLRAPIWEPGKPMKANDKGTPQGGVISPLLGNIYMHWFDKIFHGPNGPGSFAHATLVRYADDFVVMAKYMTNRVTNWIEQTLEGRFDLQINLEKTQIVDLKQESAHLDFLGFSFRRVNARRAPNRKFCLVSPSHKSQLKAFEEIRRRTGSNRGFMPIDAVVRDLNRFLRGWGQYFSFGNPSMAFVKLNTYVYDRLYKFLQRRSQRGFKKRCDDNSWYLEIKELGVLQLTQSKFV